MNATPYRPSCDPHTSWGKVDPLQFRPSRDFRIATERSTYSVAYQVPGAPTARQIRSCVYQEEELDFLNNDVSHLTAPVHTTLGVDQYARHTGVSPSRRFLTPTEVQRRQVFLSKTDPSHFLSVSAVAHRQPTRGVDTSLFYQQHRQRIVPPDSTIFPRSGAVSQVPLSHSHYSPVRQHSQPGPAAGLSTFDICRGKVEHHHSMESGALYHRGGLSHKPLGQEYTSVSHHAYRDPYR